jgi:flagellar biosynthesis/type III secretory pathway protein FliH
MAEKTKKAKAPAKPRATASAAKKTAPKSAAPKNPNPNATIAAKKKTVAEQVTAATPSREEIARLAQQFWVERGHQDGLAEQDWLRAERELISMAS